MKIGILVFGLVIIATGYIVMVAGDGNASERSEGASFLGLTIDRGTLFLMYFVGASILLFGIPVSIAGAIIMAMSKENKEKEES